MIQVIHGNHCRKPTRVAMGSESVETCGDLHVSPWDWDVLRINVSWTWLLTCSSVKVLEKWPAWASLSCCTWPGPCALMHPKVESIVDHVEPCPDQEHECIPCRRVDAVDTWPHGWMGCCGSPWCDTAYIRRTIYFSWGIPAFLIFPLLCFSASAPFYFCFFLFCSRAFLLLYFLG